MKEALQYKKKHKKKGKALDLQQRQEYHGGAVSGLLASCVRLELEKQYGSEMR